MIDAEQFYRRSLVREWSTMNSAILSSNEVKFWHLLLDRMDFARISVQPCTSAASISLRL